MATTLVSPGSLVTVTDDSAYSSAGTGTVPLIVMATHQNKTNPATNGVAEGTLAANAGKLYLLSSQREAIQTFGYPKFYQTDIGTPMHGYELNEYGLHAIYNYLGIADRVYVMTAPIDLGQLVANSYKPTGSAVSGTFWLNTSSTSWGVFTSNGNSVPGAAWNSSPTTVINTTSNVDTILFGTVLVSNPAANIILASPSTLVINGISISVTGTLNQIVASINSANITGITAIAFRNSQQSCLVIKNTNAGSISIAGTNAAVITGLGLGSSTYYSPKASLGTLGGYAIVTMNTDNVMYQYLLPQDYNGYADSQAVADWFIVGSTAWQMATPTVALGTGFTAASLLASDSISINGKTVVIGGTQTIASVIAAINTAAVPNIVASSLSTTQIRLTNTLGQDILLSNVSGTPLTTLGLASVNGNRLFYSSNTKYPTGSVSGDVWIKTTSYSSGSNWIVKVYSSVTSQWIAVSAPLVGNSSITTGQTQEQADDAAASALYGSSLVAGVLYVRYNLYGTATFPVSSHQIRRFNGSNWSPLVYTASNSAPTSTCDDGTMWYSEDFQVDIMINLNGDEWVGYAKHSTTALTDPNGPTIAASQPTSQSDGSQLENGDLWINTSDLESYPAIYRYSSGSNTWSLVDNTDSNTPFGIVFADARQDSGPQLLSSDTYAPYSTSNADLILSNFVDPDCIDPRLYPDGTLLFNMRYSTLDVKEYSSEFFVSAYDGTDYTSTNYNVGIATFPVLTSAARWVTKSGLKTDGSPYMYRQAQRQMILTSIKSIINTSDDARAELTYFNLISCPGYVEVLDELVQLNDDKKDVAFIISDTPPRLAPNSTMIQTWTNTMTTNTETTEASLGISNPYVGIYYPWGLGSNYDGTEVMVPASTIALRTIAYSDSVSYPWYAPAGFARGLVDNVTSVGYLNSSDEYQAVILNQGQRDVLYLNNINPIAYIPNRGLVIYGQKTLNAQSTALDRINVARLINYLRYQCDILSQQFLFEQNVKHTRDTAQATFSRFLGDLVSKNGLYDYIVVCDETNNTAARIDRNELWIDIAIQPVKTIEFIYIPIRIENSSTDLTQVYS